MHKSNSVAVNCDLLSDTSCLGTPYEANKCHRTRSVFWTLVNNMGMISSHLEWVSTTTEKLVPRNGPAKSTWICSQGRLSQVHGCSFAEGGWLQMFWQEVHFLTLSSDLLVKLGLPDVCSGKWFHLYNARVTWMQFIQYPLTMLVRDDHSHYP